MSRRRASRGPPREVLAFAVGYIILGAVFPRLRYGAWFSRLGRRGRVAYVAWSTGFGFAVREFARRMRRWHEGMVAELRAELGRDPTTDELRGHHVRRFLREDLGREPTAAELDDAIATVSERREHPA